MKKASLQSPRTPRTPLTPLLSALKKRATSRRSKRESPRGDAHTPDKQEDPPSVGREAGRAAAAAATRKRASSRGGNVSPREQSELRRHAADQEQLAHEIRVAASLKGTVVTTPREGDLLEPTKKPPKLKRGSRIKRKPRTRSRSFGSNQNQRANELTAAPKLVVPKMIALGGSGKKKKKKKGAASKRLKNLRDKLTSRRAAATGGTQFTASTMLDANDLVKASGFERLEGTLFSAAQGAAALSESYLIKWKDLRIIREIGEGAYATVYLASLGMLEVAVKELKLLITGDVDIKEELLETAAALRECELPSWASTLVLLAELFACPQTYGDAISLLADCVNEIRETAEEGGSSTLMLLEILETLLDLPPPALPSQLQLDSEKKAAEEIQADLMREAQVLSHIKHDNIVSFLGVCSEFDHPALILAYATRGPLSGILLSEEETIDWPLRVKWLKQTAEALKYLHARTPKIIHRDMKAENVLIDGQNRAYVTDFGLSKAKVVAQMAPVPIQHTPSKKGKKKQGESPRSPRSPRSPVPMVRGRSFLEHSNLAGTPSYLAPELWAKQRYNESVDVYAYGVFVFEMIAREVPYAEYEFDELVDLLKHSDLRPTLPDWTPRTLTVLAQTCWAKEAEKRPVISQILKLLETIERTEMLRWAPPKNSSLNPEVQAAHMESWQKKQHEISESLTAGEEKLKAAQLQLLAAKRFGELSGSQFPTTGTP